MCQGGWLGDVYMAMTWRSVCPLAVWGCVWWGSNTKICYVDCNSQVSSSPIWLPGNHTHKKTINFRESQSKTPGTLSAWQSWRLQCSSQLQPFPTQNMYGRIPRGQGWTGTIGSGSPPTNVHTSQDFTVMGRHHYYVHPSHPHLSLCQCRWLYPATFLALSCPLFHEIMFWRVGSFIFL